ncbi:DUF4871 domain-containing protein [Paenibacillus sp. GYB003]|uniref:DUF4871 domain-containing protein n=1 Tax=Paenibacillus sp. GYB003 TaxID=2994392 RepID=UPI002F967B56
MTNANRHGMAGTGEDGGGRGGDRESKPHWYEALKRPPYPAGAFGEQARRNVIGRLYGDGGRTRRKPVRTAAVASAAGVVLVAGLAWSKPWPAPDGGGSARIQKEIGNERNTRNLYTVNNVIVVEAFPGGEYAAGTPAGCWWNLHTPLDRLKDRTIRIEGVHRETGYKLEELAETKVSAVGMAYQKSSPSGSTVVEMTRIATRFALPLAGEWTFDVYLDGEHYADVVFDVPDSPWEVSPTFKSGAYDMRGVKHRLGFIDAVGFKAGKANKYMWHFWGKPEELEGKLEIKAVRQGSLRLEDVFAADKVGSALNGADAAFPSMMQLPEPGMWRLMAFIGGKLHGSVIVNVK